MRMKKLLFIYNPNAGKGLLKPRLSDILDIFVKAGYEVTVYPTQKYRDGYKKVAKFEGDYDLLVCSGGDGTLDEVVNWLMKTRFRLDTFRPEQRMILPTVSIFRRIC